MLAEEDNEFASIIMTFSGNDSQPNILLKNICLKYAINLVTFKSIVSSDGYILWATFSINYTQMSFVMLV